MAVQKLGQFWSASANNDASRAVRDQSQKTMQTARESLARVDGAEWAVKEAVDLIRRYWPTIPD